MCRHRSSLWAQNPLRLRLRLLLNGQAFLRPATLSWRFSRLSAPGLQRPLRRSSRQPCSTPHKSPRRLASRARSIIRSEGIAPLRPEGIAPLRPAFLPRPPPAKSTASNNLFGVGEFGRYCTSGFRSKILAGWLIPPPLWPAWLADSAALILAGC